MMRSDKSREHARGRFGDLFRLSPWGSRQPWRPTETEAVTVDVRRTRKLGSGRFRIQRRRKAA